MSEDSPVGSTVTTVQATDMDSAENTVVIHTSDLLPFFYTLEPRQLNVNSLQRPLLHNGTATETPPYCQNILSIANS